MSFSPDLYSFSAQTFCPVGVFKLLEKFGVLTICHISMVLHISGMAKTQKYTPAVARYISRLENVYSIEAQSPLQVYQWPFILG